MRRLSQVQGGTWGNDQPDTSGSLRIGDKSVWSEQELEPGSPNYCKMSQALELFSGVTEEGNK